MAAAEAEAAAAAPPPPPAPPPALEPRRGRLLRDELLARFGPAAPPAPLALEGRDVHDMASGDFRQAEAPKIAPAPAKPAPAKPATTDTKKRDDRDKELGDLSSGAWEKDD